MNAADFNLAVDLASGNRWAGSTLLPLRPAEVEVCIGTRHPMDDSQIKWTPMMVSRKWAAQRIRAARKAQETVEVGRKRDGSTSYSVLEV